MTPSLQRHLASLAGVEARFDEAMSHHTTYKVGGRAAAFLDISSVTALETALAALADGETPYVILGNGSNVLFADAGFSGAVIHLGRGLDAVSHEASAPGAHVLTAGAGLSITRLLRYAKEHALAGLECLGGVPGTVGGAIRMNAGTRLGEVKDSLLAAQLVAPGRPRRWVDAEDLSLSYRHSALPEGSVVTAGRFKVTDASPEMWQRLEEVLTYRKRTQPLTMPSCGSVFANPPGDAAGRLIEAAGLKGHRVGGAEVSRQHANWIINTGEATASNVRELIEICVSTVRERFGLTLRHEVQFLGDWTSLTGESNG